ncbi:hypothetical protein [Parvularcula lutaonensis]|uniref:Chromosome partition protein Smc n=1 Tax=Parvularcula lutaonensis TaxID=491923 RepID=A0ABV7MES6_9PROT|nr:hypothetical protein [Parvularcula lutaonensis]GGY52555.1 hypothetical protein GCM10007148_22140 [Parvularcula lutaonensis]
MAPVENEAAAEKKTDSLPAAEPTPRPMLVAERPDSGAPERPGWLPNPEQIWLASRIAAVLILVVWLVAWPIGTTIGLRAATGVWKLAFGYNGAVAILALTNAGLVLAGGYLLRAALRLEATADRLGRAVRNFEPSLRADAVREDLNLLGGEIDAAIAKLARAEKQIRDQVGAIEEAAETLKSGTSQGTDRLAKERQALIEATAAMNKEAEGFAKALADRTAAEDGKAKSILPELEAKLKRLEAIAEVNADQFAALREAMAESTQVWKETPQHFSEDIKGSTDTLRKAQQELMEESEKLRKLIDQQKDRADNLGRSLAEQSERLKTRTETQNKSLGGSWKRILDKVEKQVGQQQQPGFRAEPTVVQTAKTSKVTKTIPPTAQKPADELPTPPFNGEEDRLERMHRFTMEMKSQLFGEPTKAEKERFERGERQLFTRQILEQDPIIVRARLRAAIEDDEEFAAAAENFLSDFDQLLAPVIAEDPEGAEAALQNMLRSPLGQLYVLIGTAKGHFV